MTPALSLSDKPGLYIGLDLGTSGCRAIAIDSNQQVITAAAVSYLSPGENDPARLTDPGHWWQCSQQLITRLCKKVDSALIRAIAVDGTSATLLLTDEDGQALSPVLMYNDARCIKEATLIATVAPAESPARGVTSSLAKLLYLQARQQKAAHAMHQSDWITSLLSGRRGYSDENNCLKLGYDVINRRWPTWLKELPFKQALLPEVVPAGTMLGAIDPRIATQLGLPLSTKIISGTTDGVAAFLATGATEIGDAVTSLGSTLVIKILAERPLFAPEFGIYSHRLGDHWLIGGASNCGGATLLQHFTLQQLNHMIADLKPEQPTGLHYYPLPATGERFPVNDRHKAAELTPRPADDVVFFQAMLEGIAAVEARAYALLAELGAPDINTLRTVGGGASNQAWQRIRQNHMKVRFAEPRHLQAAYGTALLALAAY